MSSRIEFLIREEDFQRTCTCSKSRPKIASYNGQKEFRSYDSGSSFNKMRQKCKRRKVDKNQNAESLSKFITKSMERSSFIGLSKVASSKTPFLKIIWSILTACSIIGFLYQALKFAFVYKSLPTEVTLRVENNGTVQFPAVTVCNNNRIRKSEYCKHYPQKCSSVSSLKLTDAEIFDAYFEAITSMPNHKFQLGHSMKLIRGCIFNGIKKIDSAECLKRFVPLFDTDYGNCFTFLSSDHESEEHLEANEADFWNTVNDLILLLDLEAEEYTEEKRQPALLITVHSNEYIPDIHTDSIRVERGSEYDFSVEQSVTMLLPFPYETNCTDFTALPWVSEHAVPSSRICTVGCSRHFQLEKCGYVTRNLSLFYEKLPWEVSSITKEQEKCAEQVEDRTKSYCRTLCGVPCLDIQFEVAVGKTVLQESEVMDFYTDVQEIDHQWENWSIVRVFYKTIERKVYEHGAMYDDLELFSYLGGYSGIWLGFSLLNLCELVEIILLSVRHAVLECTAKSKVKDSRKKIRTYNQNFIKHESNYKNSSEKPLKVKRQKTMIKCCNF